MKIAISGKGGVGKSTLAGTLALLLAEQGRRVVAVDADPVANLAVALGLSAAQQAGIVPIAEQVALIEERTGAKVQQYGQMFRLNPQVSDITETYATLHRGVALLVLGAVPRGGGGCACPESILIRALVTDLVLFREEALVLDMEAGVEHLGRGTARGVDTMVIVVEPGQRSLDCARRVVRMCGELGIRDLCFVANKVTGPEDEAFIREALPAGDLLGCIPFTESIRQADRSGTAVLDVCPPEVRARFETILRHLEKRQPP
jgi:CO dehydrogenase maturation factor